MSGPAFSRGLVTRRPVRSRTGYSRRAAAALTLIFALVLSACSSQGGAAAGHSGGRYAFANATASGTVIPVAARKAAGPFAGTNFDGRSYRLAAHRGRVVLINYWASWCAPCVSESPLLSTVFESMRSRAVDFVGVDVKDDRQAAQTFIADKHMSYPMVYDEAAKTALQLGIPSGGLPVTILVDRTGRIAAVYLGAVDRSGITSALQRLIAETA